MAVSSHSKLPNKTVYSGADLKIFIKDLTDTQSRKRPLTVKTWSTIKDVKDALSKSIHVPPSAQRLYFGPLMTELPNHRSLFDAGIYRSGETLALEIKGTTGTTISSSAKKTDFKSSISSLTENGTSDICISKSFLDLTPKSLRRSIQQIRNGLSRGIKPSLVLDGSGGTYFLHSPLKVKLAVFKPGDEEPYAPNNPRGYVSSSSSSSSTGASSNGHNAEDGGMYMRAGIKPGEACLREVAVSLLDKGGFSSVPKTTLVEARHSAFHYNGSMLNLSQGGAAVGTHSLVLVGSSISNTLTDHNKSLSSPTILEKKVGSCQEYVHAECSMDDLSPSKLTTDQVHKIAILDIRVMNADRNSANLLCVRNRDDPDTFDLVPIDHGYCLRTVADVCWFDWCWLDWPQTKKPMSQKSKDYVLGLDIEGDMRMLKERFHIPTEALNYFEASSKLLKEGVRAGMTLHDIAVLCCRNDDAGEKPSVLESIISMANDLATLAVDNGRWHHAAASQALENLLSPQHEDNTLSKRRSLNMIKSASSVNFSMLHHQGSSSLSSAPPLPLASSGSDSSSEAGNSQNLEEEEDCEEWAAAVIADTLDSELTPVSNVGSYRTRQRAISIASTGSEESSLDSDEELLSSSPAGFWSVHPNLSKHKNTEDDLSWTPENSPFLSSSSAKLGHTPELESLDLNSTSVKSVKFDDAALTLADGTSPHDNSNYSFTHLKENLASTSLTSIPRLQRSQSYSAFSFQRITSQPLVSEKNTRAGPSTSPTANQYRVYFHKFIDLLITRETTKWKTTHNSTTTKDALRN
jgi:hypothetical protein